MPLLWILLYHLIDQDLQESEPREDECPGQTLSKEEIAERRKAEEEWLASVKRANLVLKVVTWLAATFLVVYVAYVRPLATPEQQQLWFSFPELAEYNPESIRETISSTLWFLLDVMIFFFPVFFMFILAMLIFRGWKLDDLSKER